MTEEKIKKSMMTDINKGKSITRIQEEVGIYQKKSFSHKLALISHRYEEENLVRLMSKKNGKVQQKKAVGRYFISRFLTSEISCNLYIFRV